MKKASFWKQLFLGLAVIFGLTKVIAGATGLSVLSEVGRTSAIALNPSPYLRIDKVLPSQMGRQLSFACESHGVIGPWHFWDYHTRNTISGPHRRTIGILHYFSMAQSTERNEMGQKRFADMNQFFFCKNGPLAQWIGCGPDVSVMHFKWYAGENPDLAPTEASQACLP